MKKRYQIHNSTDGEPELNKAVLQEYARKNVFLPIPRDAKEVLSQKVDQTLEQRQLHFRGGQSEGEQQWIGRVQLGPNN